MKALCFSTHRLRLSRASCLTPLGNTFHPTSRLRWYFSRRRISTGLFFIPSKPLEVHPKHPATLATFNFVKGNGRELLLYETLQSHRHGPAPTGVALALFSDFASVKQQLSIGRLPPLPALSARRWALEEAHYTRRCADEVAEDEINRIESDGFELPPHLIPQQMDDGIIMSDDFEGMVESNPDTDLEDYMDEVDYKNALPDYDPDQDGEDYIDNARSWIDADKKECLVGARTRIYQGFDVPKDTSKNEHLNAEVWEPKPVRGESELAPYLFITQIPDKGLIKRSDDAFLRMFHRYGYLTSYPQLCRISAFRQDHPAFPRWLLVQEFDDFWAYDSALKKREAEHWWRKNGWEGCVVEFFKLRPSSGKERVTP